MRVFFYVAMMALGTGSAVGATAAPAPAVVVHIKDFAYVPRSVTVPAGTTVRFVNDDTEGHTVTAVDRTFDSNGLDTGDSWTHRFAAPGTFAYFCAIHPYMHGSIVVTK